MNDYTEIEFTIGYDVEKAVNALLGHRENGDKVCGRFNGTMLFSDTVTMDSAYLSIVGKTKEEMDKDMYVYRKKLEQERKEHEDNTPELIRRWIIRGAEVLPESKIEYWKETVPYRVSDIYKGMELGNCLDIVELLKHGSLEDAKKLIESQGHSGMSYSLVSNMVKEFSDRGSEFFEYINK